jgi:glycosyltransferase involved in cell wall biosynthesis
MQRPGRVALITPFASPAVGGNAVTASRIARGLRERGVDVRVWDTAASSEAAIGTEMNGYRPALVHAFHAGRVGPLALRLAGAAGIPLIVTLTGTDANHDLFDPERSPVVRRVLEGAVRLTVFHDSIGERVVEAVPALRRRLVTVPQSVRLDTAPFDLAAQWALPRDRLLFLFPAGLRAVKRPQFALGALDPVHQRHPAVRLLYAGPVLDAGEGEGLRSRLAGRPWARHIGAVPHAAMGALLAQADVVLNCSLSEGGMANSVLEALAMGRPVIASDIEGNRSVIEHGVTGLLFRDEAELEAGAEALVRDEALRARLGEAGRLLVERHFPPWREIDGYLEVYGQAVGAACRGPCQWRPPERAQNPPLR